LNQPWTACKNALVGAVAWLNQPLGRRRLFILLSGQLVCTYAACVLSYVMSIPEFGIRFSLTRDIYRVDETFVHPEFRDASQHLLPEDKDQVLELGNDKVSTWGQLLRKISTLRTETPRYLPEGTSLAKAQEVEPQLSLARIGGDTWVRVRFQKANDGPEGVVWCRVSRPSFESVFPSILWFLIKAGLFLVGALVFWKRPEDRSAMQFFLLCTVTVSAYMGGYHWQRIATQPVLLLVFIASAVMLPAVSLHFYLLFPRPKELLLRRPTWSMGAIYALPTIFLLLIVATYLQLRDLTHAQLLPWSAGLNEQSMLSVIQLEVYVYFGVAATLYLACVVSLILSYRVASNATERNQVKWILIGATAALVPIGYTLYLAFARQDDFGGGAATPPMFLASVCFTAAFAISITRYRLMQLDQIIGSGVTYFVISSVFGLVYYALVFTIMWAVGNDQVNLGPVGQALGISGTALVLLIVFDVIRGRLKKVLDHHFRREKFQIDRTLRRMSQAIERLVDPPTLARRLLHTSAELLGANKGAIYLREGIPPLYRLTDHLGSAPALTELSSGCPLIEALAVRGTMLCKPSPIGVDPAQRQLQFLGGELAHALMHEDQMLALVVLGPREAAGYSSDDLNLLTAFAHMTSLALVSAEGHRTIDTLNRDLHAKVAKIAEQQRRITTLQSQLLNQTSVQSPFPRHQAQNPAVEDLEAAAVSTPHGEVNGNIVGSSHQVRQLLHIVRKVAASPSAVLLRGESGTGKEVLARALHEASPRAKKPFVKVHCAALSPGLLESELFGHVKGAFTGAHKDKTGRFELAHGGTLFLDEIGDITLEVQTKLLRVLQEMTFERVGSSEAVQVDVRLVAATHQDLEELIRRGRFREDLYYRLNVISIPVPPLRERREDIPELAQHFLRVYGKRGGKDVGQLEDDALVALKGYSWPGNIRQLENVMERAVVICEGPMITIDDLPPEILQEPPFHYETPLKWEPDSEGTVLLSGKLRAERVERERMEREQLVRALAAADGNKAEAARALGLARSTLFSKLKKYGLS
jgi:transcriptional regulator with GAF, ATPase, and Fis domain